MSQCLCRPGGYRVQGGPGARAWVGGHVWASLSAGAKVPGIPGGDCLPGELGTLVLPPVSTSLPDQLDRFPGFYTFTFINRRGKKAQMFLTDEIKDRYKNSNYSKHT